MKQTLQFLKLKHPIAYGNKNRHTAHEIGTSLIMLTRNDDNPTVIELKQAYLYYLWKWKNKTNKKLCLWKWKNLLTTYYIELKQTYCF